MRLAGLHLGQRLGVALDEHRLVVAEPLEQVERLVVTHRLDQAVVPVDRAGIDRELALPGRVRQVLPGRRRRQALLLDQLGVVADRGGDDVDDALVALGQVEPGRQRRDVLRRVRLQRAGLQQLGHLGRVAGDDVGVVLAAALLGDDPLRDLVRRQPQRVHLHVRVGLVERGDHRLHVVVGEGGVPGERALLSRPGRPAAGSSWSRDWCPSRSPAAAPLPLPDEPQAAAPSNRPARPTGRSTEESRRRRPIALIPSLGSHPGTWPGRVAAVTG